MNKKASLMSWADRFALIAAYNPTPNAICNTFGLTENELNTANALLKAGTFAVNTSLDTTKYKGIFSESVVYGNNTAEVFSKPETASKTKVVQAPKKRGRKGTKITQGLLAITSTPVPAEEFAAQHGISLAVLRQAKRFISQLPVDLAATVGRVNVKQDPTTKTLMVWKEDIQ